MTATPSNAVRPEALSERLAAGAERLRERLARIGVAAEGDPIDPSELSDPQGALGAWARAFAAGDRAALDRRLSWDGWSPRQAAAALTDRHGPPSTPDWWLELEELALLGRDLRSTTAGPGIAGLPLGVLWAPWVAAATARLADRTAGWMALSSPVRERLECGLAAEIARLSLAAAREWLEEQPVAGEAAIDQLLSNGLLGLYERYPVLLRQTVRLVVTWVAALAELFERLEADRVELGHRFARPDGIGALVDLERLASDRHAGGRGVFALRFRSRLELVYKPRNLSIEGAFAAFVAALAGRGAEDLPPVAAVLERPEHGWMERVLHSGPADPAGVARWFRSAGGLVALAELLGGQDLHAENLIATAAGPVVVDAEMLLQPDRAGADLARTRSFAAGLLPRPGARDREAAWAGLVPIDSPAAGAPALHNACVFEGRSIAPAERRSELLEGYAATWRFLWAERRWILAEDGPLELFRRARVRLLFRASQDYASVLALIAEPRRQRDGVAGGLLLEGLLRPFAEHRARPLLWPLVGPEARSLEDLDLPRFEIGAADRALGTDDGAIEGFLVRSGLEAARARLESLERPAIAGRVAEIADALAGPESSAISGTASAVAGPSESDLAALALRLADALYDATAPDLPVDAARSAADRLSALALYDGAIGVAVALAEVDRRLGGERARRRLPVLLDDLERLAAAVAVESDGTDSLPIGALTGTGSVVWGLVGLAEVARPPEAARCLELAGRFATLTARRLAADRRLDLEGGAGGALLAFLALAERSHEPGWRVAATAAGDHLLRAQGGDGGWAGERGLALAGFAHGAAGIARALEALARATGEPRFAAAATVGLGFERSFYDARRGNWPVLQPDPRLGEPRRSWMTAWCHGAPGVGLGRALAPAIEDGAVAAEIATAMATTLETGLGTQDHLCCGAAGRIAVLSAVGELRGEERWRTAGLELTGRLVARARAAGGWRLPAGSRAARRGLFRGEAGLVWLLARLAIGGGAPGASAAGGPDPIRLELPSEAAARRVEREGG